MVQPHLTANLEHLQQLPFVRRTRLRGRGQLLEITTPSDRYELTLAPVRSHLTRELAAHQCATLTDAHLMLVPAVGRDLGDQLEAAGVNFVDEAGNCYLNLGNRYVARIQGRRLAPRPTAQKALRAPAYRALFAVLAKPDLVGASVRQLAEGAGVSRQAAIDIRKRLAELDVLVESNGTYRWRPQHAHIAMDMFLTGYATTLRPRLLLGRFRGPHTDPDETEKEIATRLPKGLAYRWGGGSGLDRLTHYYHGPNTVLHVDNPPADLPRRLRLIRDNAGPIHLLTFPGPAGLEGVSPDTAHPLLMHAELLVEGGDRAREAAADLFARYLPQERFE